MSHSLPSCGPRAAAVLLCALAAPLFAQAEVWVDPTRPLFRGTGTPADPYGSIREALRFGTRATVLHLRPGLYSTEREQFPIVPTRPVTFHGHGRATIVLGNSETAFDLSRSARVKVLGLTFVASGGDASRAVGIFSTGQQSSQQIDIEGCRFRQLGQGVDGTGGAATAWLIRSNLFDSVRDTAIALRGRLATGRIEHNTIYNSARTGVFVEGSKPIVRFNILQGNDAGVEAGSSGQVGPNVSDNVLWRNRNNFIRIPHPGPRNVDADPRLLDPARGDFRLNASSRFIDIAAATGAGADLDESPRLANGFDVGPTLADYGAYERNPLAFDGSWPGGTRIELALNGTRGRAAAILLGTAEGAARLNGTDLLLDAGSIGAVIGGTLPLQVSGNTPVYAGARVLAQGVSIDRSGSGILLSRRVEVAAERELNLIESLSRADLSRLDRSASSGDWQFGRLGGDGLHGDFDITLGRSLGSGVWEFDTDRIVIPRTHTLSSLDEVVTDGVLRFSSFRVGAGHEVRFIGSKPAVIYVRGEVVVDGKIVVDGQTIGPAILGALGQPGSAGGPFGGRGGTGGDRCLGTGPQPRFNGRSGADVQLLAGHAYASRAPGTGGKGSLLYPPAGTNASVRFVGFFSLQATAAGAGGGNATAGSAGTVTSTNPVGAPSIPGQPISIFPVPSNADPIDHFLVGGSGGGGGGSHPMRSIIPVASWKKGGGGAGGGGALAFSVGRSVTVGSGGVLSARGGSGQINVVAVAPGGAGSGGSIYLAIDGPLQQNGLIDVTGGTGATIRDAASKALLRGGDGGAGLIRVEAQSGGLGRVQPAAGTNRTGPLTRQDQRTGLRSKWIRSYQSPQTLWLRYVLETRIQNGNVTFSDDPARGVLATTGQAIELRVQGARVDQTTGEVDPSTRTPWLNKVQDLNAHHVDAIRFDLIQDRGVATVQALRGLTIALDGD